MSTDGHRRLRAYRNDFEDPATGERRVSPIPRDIVWVVIRARGEEICRLQIPVEELLGDTPYVPPTKAEG